MTRHWLDIFISTQVDNIFAGHLAEKVLLFPLTASWAGKACSLAWHADSSTVERSVIPEVAVLGSSGTVTLAAWFPMVCVASLACVGGVVGLLVDAEGETSFSVVELVSCWSQVEVFWNNLSGNSASSLLAAVSAPAMLAGRGVTVRSVGCQVQVSQRIVWRQFFGVWVAPTHPGTPVAN